MAARCRTNAFFQPPKALVPAKRSHCAIWVRSSATPLCSRCAPLIMRSARRLTRRDGRCLAAVLEITRLKHPARAFDDQAFFS
jgi:hypothetical protein